VSSPKSAADVAFAGVDSGQHVLTVGNFDGVHLGHRHLLDQVIEVASQRAVRSMVVTFEPHPIAVLRPEHAPPRLATPSSKVDLLRQAGIEDVVVLPFDRNFASLTADEFVEMLVTYCRPTDILVGEGFRFGRQRSGDTETLQASGREHGFRAHVIAPLMNSTGVVSSSRIRMALQSGNIEDAAGLLGRRVRLCGAVEHGMARGRDLGYPTANLAIPGGLCVPADGIYAGYAHLDDRDGNAREALIYIGTSPTFGDRERVVEVNILDYRGDLYSQELEIEFLAFIRSDMKFDNSDALMQQMAQDEATARTVLEGSQPEQLTKGNYSR
jgi:riboflavin kinase / FMN adenylyltransferase